MATRDTLDPLPTVEPGNLDTATLIASAQRGEAAALDALIGQQLPELRAFVRLSCDPIVRARESCSDLVQSVCREVLGKLDEFEYRGEKSFRNWLFSWAIYKIKNRVHFYRADKRDAAREVAPAPSSEAQTRLAECYATMCDASDQAIGNELVERIEAAFDQLSEADRDVVLRFKLLGQSHAEIARELHCSEQAIRTRLSRALMRLLRLCNWPEN